MTTAARPRNFEALQTKDQLVNMAQHKIRDSLDSILQVPFLNGVLLEGVALTGGYENLVEHKLGRKFQGWLVVDITDPAVIIRYADSTADNKTYLPLYSSATTTVNLWVF